MESIGVSGLVGKIENWVELESMSGGDFLINDYLFGFEGGKLVTYGKLNLPVSIEAAKEESTGSNEIYIWTHFSGERFNQYNTVLEFIDYPHIDSFFSRLFEMEEGSVLFTNASNRSPFDALITDHIGEYLRIYDKCKEKEAATEAQRNIRNGFIDYRKVS